MTEPCSSPASSSETDAAASAAASSSSDYRAYVRGQIHSLMDTLTHVMFGDFTVVARTHEPDEDFGYLCAMVNVAISAARNAQAELRRVNEQLQVEVEERRRAEMQIRESRTLLQTAHDALERRVEERTRDLQREVAERSKAEHALRAHEERTRLIIDTAFDAIVSADADERIIEWNTQAEAIFGWTAIEAQGRRLAELIIPPQFREAHRAGLKRFLSTGEGPILNRRIEVLGQHKDGREIPIDIAVTAVRVGECHVFNAILRDITERKKAEAQLAEAHRQLMVFSREAGMAEVATGVLHSVGNVLSSVNVSANLLADYVRESKGSSLSRLIELLREHRHDLGEFVTNDIRGKLLLTYLEQLDEQLRAERHAVMEELKCLQGGIEHIKKIVAMQQSYAKVIGVQEQVRISDLIEDSLRLNAAAFDRHDIEIVRELQDASVINTDKHKVLQILVNLVSNAKYACVESGRTDKRVTVRAFRDDERVRVFVSDNGVGIAPEDLTRIFSHGFTTRKTGHGFGLHSGALAARGLGGSLTAHSQGPGKGATFILELPLQSAQTVTEAQVA